MCVIIAVAVYRGRVLAVFCMARQRSGAQTGYPAPVTFPRWRPRETVLSCQFEGALVPQKLSRTRCRLSRSRSCGGHPQRKERSQQVKPFP
ncbi:hypothetical protein NDU88_009558 [Pleurodeles waltl]|uniref:Secreted protein n=1 Tax=Pleurodeles waltl TaxID=8319 RepID=A0AAV7P2S2_PLEWA|nr:hypothetical protein NDU88_009558 [Pleurodeles waltl]